MLKERGVVALTVFPKVFDIDTSFMLSFLRVVMHANMFVDSSTSITYTQCLILCLSSEILSSNIPYIK